MDAIPNRMLVVDQQDFVDFFLVNLPENQAEMNSVNTLF